MIVHYHAIPEIAHIAAMCVDGQVVDYSSKDMTVTVSADPVQYENAYDFWELAWRLGFPYAYVAGAFVITHHTGTYIENGYGFRRRRPIRPNDRRPVRLRDIQRGDAASRRFIKTYYKMWYRAFRDTSGG